MAKTTIPAGYFAAGSIATADIADDAVTADKLAANSVVSASIVNGTIATADLADDAITSAKIADNAITAAMVPNATALTLDGGLTVDNITINGTEIDLSSGDLTVDVAGNLILAPGTDEVRLVGGSNDTAFGKFYSSSGNFYINMPTQDKDIIFSGNDGGSTISPMIIDMSEGGIVGIGTTAPDTLLELSSAVGTGTSLLKLRNSSSAAINNISQIDFELDNSFSGVNVDVQIGAIKENAGNEESSFYIKTTDGTGTPTERVRVDSSGNVGIGTTSPTSQLTLSAATPTIQLIDSDNNADAYIQGTDGNIKFFADDNAEASSSEITFALDGTQRAKIDADGDFTATNVYAGASGLQTELVSFPCTTAYPNNSTYTLTLTAAQAPLGSRVIMGIWISSGNSGGDQYCYLVQGQAHGPRLMLHVDDWYYNDGAMSMFKIDNAADRDFNVTHGTIVATNSNDFRKIYYYGYIMDN